MAAESRSTERLSSKVFFRTLALRCRCEAKSLSLRLDLLIKEDEAHRILVLWSFKEAILLILGVV